MVFQKAQGTDLEAVFQLYKSVIGTPFCVWDDEYPGWQDIDEDYRNDNLFVMKEDDKLLGAISIITNNELDALDFWKEPNAKEFARVVVAPNCQGRGIAAQMVAGVFRELRNRNIPAVHLLVAKANLPAQQLYRKCGFAFLGTCFMFGHDYIGCEIIL